MEKKEIGSAIWRMDRTLQEVDEELMENGGELTLELQTRLDESGLTSEQVVDGLQQLITKTKAEDAVLGDEIKRLQALKKSRSNGVEGLKRYLLQFMLSHGIDKIEGTFAKAVKTNTPPTVVAEESLLLAKYNQYVDDLRAKLPSWISVDVRVNKTELLKVMKETGIEPDGAYITHGSYVRIS